MNGEALKPSIIVMDDTFDPDADKPEKYGVTTLAKLHCENNVLTIDNPIAVKGLLNGFMGED